ncbi:MAG: hypothetical protein ACKVPX_11365 [Myxococcaceae bacterium]
MNVNGTAALRSQWAMAAVGGVAVAGLAYFFTRGWQAGTRLAATVAAGLLGAFACVNGLSHNRSGSAAAHGAAQSADSPEARANQAWAALPVEATARKAALDALQLDAKAMDVIFQLELGALMKAGVTLGETELAGPSAVDTAKSILSSHSYRRFADAQGERYLNLNCQPKRADAPQRLREALAGGTHWDVAVGATRHYSRERAAGLAKFLVRAAAKESELRVRGESQLLWKEILSHLTEDTVRRDVLNALADALHPSIAKSVGELELSAFLENPRGAPTECLSRFGREAFTESQSQNFQTESYLRGLSESASPEEKRRYLESAPPGIQALVDRVVMTKLDERLPELSETEVRAAHGRGEIGDRLLAQILPALEAAQRQAAVA